MSIRKLKKNRIKQCGSLVYKIYLFIVLVLTICFSIFVYTTFDVWAHEANVRLSNFNEFSFYLFIIELINVFLFFVTISELIFGSYFRVDENHLISSHILTPFITKKKIKKSDITSVNAAVTLSQRVCNRIFTTNKSCHYFTTVKRKYYIDSRDVKLLEDWLTIPE